MELKMERSINGSRAVAFALICALIFTMISWPVSGTVAHAAEPYEVTIDKTNCGDSLITIEAISDGGTDKLRITTSGSVSFPLVASAGAVLLDNITRPAVVSGAAFPLNITLKDVEMVTTSTAIDGGHSAFELTGGADVYLNLDGDNVLESAAFRAGIELNGADSDITIDSASGDGKLNVKSGNAGAGIGSARNGTGGNITILGGNITANSKDGASIGSGGSVSGTSAVGDITISGSSVVKIVCGNAYASGIGAGPAHDIAYAAQVNNILIGGETSISAILGSSSDASGIGAGYAREGTSSVGGITITGKAKINISNFYNGAGIGSGRTRNGGKSIVSNININGESNIILRPESYNDGEGAGIGSGLVAGGTSGSMSEVESISIGGNSIIDVHHRKSAGIGSGGAKDYSSNVSHIKEIIIKDDAVINTLNVVTLPLQGAGIGSGNADVGTSSVGSVTISGGFVTTKANGSAVNVNNIGLGSVTNGGVSQCGSVVIAGGSVWARDGRISPAAVHAIGGADAYEVVVPDFGGMGAEITVPLQGGLLKTYKAKTTSSNEEHGSDFPSTMAALIYLPAFTSYTGIGISGSRMSYAANVTSASVVPVGYNIITEVVRTGGGGSVIISGSKYTVTFDSNGGSTVSSQTVTEGKKATRPQGPTRDGYKFTGWFTDKALTKEYDFNTAVTKSFTLYAGWEEGEPELPFTDIENHWAKDAILFVYENELFGGVGNGKFDPDSEMNRGMVVTVLARYYEQTNGMGVAGYTDQVYADVLSGTYYFEAVNFATDKGFAEGFGINANGDNIFGPERPVTREQMAKFMALYIEKMNITIPVTLQAYPAFTDQAKIGSWSASYVDQMRQAGIIEGRTDGSFGPQDLITRAEAAAMFQRLLEKAGN